MDTKRIFFVFFTLMSLTTTAGFIYAQSEISIFIATAVNIISSFMHIGARNLIAAESLTSSLVADLHLIPSFIALVIYGNSELSISFAIGAIIANVFSLILTLIASTQNEDEEY